MPLVKGGKITEDIFAHVADGAELPAEGNVLVSAARFLENPEALFARAAKVGVIWPNNRDVDDVVPWLEQFVFMLRAGFDAFEVKKDADAEAFAQTVQRYSVFYQPTGDGKLTALHRRMQLRHSESAGL